jgi:hypothetical protein
VYVAEQQAPVATPIPIIEENVQTFDVSNIWEEAGEVWRQGDYNALRDWRKLAWR